MKRFIATVAIGATALLGGGIALAFGLHPEGLATLGALAQGCIALMLGTAVFSSGMLGLADGYDKVATRLDEFLQLKQPPAAADLEVRDGAQLSSRHKAFWRGYRRTAAGLCLFLAGFLGLTTGLGDLSLSHYVTAVGIGIAFLVVAALTLSFGGLRGMRRTHVAVDRAAGLFASQPDTVTHDFPEPLARKRRAAKRALFGKRSARQLPLENRRYPKRSVHS